MDAKNSIDLETDPRLIIGSRVFDAPRALVFSAFTDPKHLAHPNAQLRLPARRDLAPCDAWAGRTRLPKSHHV